MGLLRTKFVQLIAILLLSGCSSVVDYDLSLRTYEIDQVDKLGSRFVGINDGGANLWLGPQVTIYYEFFKVGE